MDGAFSAREIEEDKALRLIWEAEDMSIRLWLDANGAINYEPEERATPELLNRLCQHSAAVRYILLEEAQKREMDGWRKGGL